MKSGYEQIYIDIIHLLAGIDFTDAASRLGLRQTEGGELSVDFLRRPYKISRAGVDVLDGNPVPVNNRSILVYYAASTGAGEPTHVFRPLSSFSHGLFTSGERNSLKWMASPLVKAFGANRERLAAVLSAMGATVLGNVRLGEYAWLYNLLPKIPCKIVYEEADEDFPCNIKILLDDGALRFLAFEQLAFLNGAFVGALISADGGG